MRCTSSVCTPEPDSRLELAVGDPRHHLQLDGSIDGVAIRDVPRQT